MNTLTAPAEKSLRIETMTVGKYNVEVNYTEFSAKATYINKVGRKVTHFYYSFRRFVKNEITGVRELSVDRSTYEMEKFVILFATEITNAIAAAAKVKADKKAAIAAAKENTTNPFMVGQIFYNSWGYEQTNVNFYEVVEVKKSSVVVREIARHYDETGYLCGHSTPKKGQFVGEPHTKIVRINYWNGKTEYGIADYSLWDGKAKYESHYA